METETNWPHIESAADYARYLEDVGSFLADMEGEPSSGRWDVDVADGDDWPEPYFSWRPCDCCGRALGGDREDVIGWLRGAREARYTDAYQWSGSACTDCVYYFANGQLDDMTMLAVDA